MQTANFKKACNTVKTEEDGSVTILSVFILLTILVVTGAAVDLMRTEQTRVELQSSLDRAVIAAADLDQLQEPTAVVQDYLTKSGLGDALSSASVTSALNARTVSGSGEVNLDTVFMRMSGWDTLNAPALSVADERIANVEISLILDISGSMRYNDRMNRMKPAAQDFVSKVMSEESVGVTTLNLVPFAGHVNPGDTLFDHFRGVRPPLPEEPPAEEETTTDPVTTDPVEPTPEIVEDYFEPWSQAISNLVMYFDTDGDDVYNRAHKIEGFPETAPRDVDDFFRGAVAYAMANDPKITHPGQFLGISIKGGQQDTRYFQVKGDVNGPDSDLGPTKNRGRIPGSTFSYGSIDYDSWAASYVSPNPEVLPETADDGAETNQQDSLPPQNVNMPSSCVEIYDGEFLNTDMPTSEDYVPHFMFWDIAEEVMEWGWCPGEDATIQYYSSDRQALIDYIGAMPMYDGTGLPYGMKYGLSLLDPNNRDEVSFLISEGLVDSRFEGRPIDWNDAETEKYIVLMTDGQTTDQYRPVDPTAAINGEVELNNQGSDSYYNFSGRSTNVSNLLTQCDLAKQLGVTVFTIAFETNQAATNDMRACASSVSHFFHVQGEEISDAFDMVARQINNLRLIQ